ncbi:MAG: histidine phosphatase family protein [Coleofasciculaceae cyanobacterium SM2_1_6]|nr:histidine phosphatase family protein [Coleofasciculaceae cyanobacterium SM2_1_6]
MSKTIWIARHANRLDFVHPEWFLTAELPYDPPLSEDGLYQAGQLAQRLSQEPIAHIFASPFLRTIQTAHQVAEALALPLKLESGLSEWLNPEWMPDMPDRHSLADLQAQFPRIDPSYVSRVVPEFPETGEIALSRAGQTARLLAEEFSGDLLLVGHGASVMGATTGILGTPVQVNASLCCLIKLVQRQQHWSIELNGDTSHLTHRESVIQFHRAENKVGG